MPPPSGCGELWKPIAGHPNCYVSWFGRVIGPRGKVLTPRPGSVYPRVTLYPPGCKGKGTYREVHALVLEAFVGPRPPGMECCRHLNGDGWDNWLGNLCWGTDSENSHDAVEHGVHPQSRRTECVNGHEYTPENTRWIPGRGRSCRACRRDFDRRRRQRQKGSA